MPHQVLAVAAITSATLPVEDDPANAVVLHHQAHILQVPWRLVRPLTIPEHTPTPSHVISSFASNGLDPLLPEWGFTYVGQVMGWVDGDWGCCRPPWCIHGYSACASDNWRVTHDIVLIIAPDG
jgi:hypothetical protein